ncbi:FAD-dependent oxidoreductase [Falsiroseomonas sp. E2-1-a20]|uniref:FAD-dependent oxidoreductase n=1 Tax=Falsiroseomonas sp. E2-1-a20 TaxID=3239300 RepID=UPI003F38B7C6
MSTDLAAPPPRAVLHPRPEQTFPILTPAEIDRLRRFGALRRYAEGEFLFEAGKPGPGMFVVLSGQVVITQRDGLGHVTPVVEQGPGHFLAEVGQLSGNPALVDGVAEGAVEVLLIPPEGLRAALVAEAELGERIMRALILRRVSLIRSGAGGPTLIARSGSLDLVRLQGFLARNGWPHQLLTPDSDAGVIEIVARYAPAEADWPLVVCPDGSVLRNPEETALARCLGMLRAPARPDAYDVAVVGAGPAGLATAVYSASEGLSVVVLDQRAYGGQAGASARIENYFGFPTGISGHALASRAFVQAQKFGVEMMIPAEVTGLSPRAGDGSYTIAVAGGEAIRARTIVIASGARYRRPSIPRLAEFEGRGVWYWASPDEAKLCAGSEVVLVGGGNSAGQAAVYLSAHAAKVRMLVRGAGLAASMSRYLIDRIEAAGNIELLCETEIVELGGVAQSGLDSVVWQHRRTGEQARAEVRHVFLFVGADPATGWLQGSGIALDRAGFVTTGSGTLATSLPGVFAIGDVRSGSVKRVGGAIGEGAGVVPLMHAALATA